jgi:magnesium-transporting ATPase (P-type)
VLTIVKRELNRKEMNATSRSGLRLGRHLYVGTSLIFLALVFWTFARTFYLKPFFRTPPLSALLHIHGAVMTGWVVLLAAQTTLIAAHRVSWHRWLGIFGSVWAALVVLLGSITTLHAAEREVRDHTGFAASQVTITSLDLLQMLFFAVFVALAILQRRRPAYHKRLMLLTIACMLPDALARLPVSFMTNQLIMLGLVVCIFVVVGLDTLWQRRLHPVFAWGGLLFIVAFHVALYFSQTPAWIKFGEALLA